MVRIRPLILASVAVASVLASIVAATRRRLWITNAYFAPRRRAVAVLGEAARRGELVPITAPGGRSASVPAPISRSIRRRTSGSIPASTR